MHTPPPDWTRDEVLTALHNQGTSLRALARAYGVTVPSLARAFEAQFAPTAQQRLAAALGVAPQTIWPSRYEADGRPKTRRATGGEHWMKKSQAAREAVARRLVAAAGETHKHVTVTHTRKKSTRNKNERNAELIGTC